MDNNDENKISMGAAPSTESLSEPVIEELKTDDFPPGTISLENSSENVSDDKPSAEIQNDVLQEMLSFSTKENETEPPKKESALQNLPEILVPELTPEQETTPPVERPRPKKKIDMTILISGIVIAICLLVIVGVVVFIGTKDHSGGDSNDQPSNMTKKTQTFEFNGCKYIIADDIRYTLPEDNSSSILFYDSANTIAGSFAVGPGNFDNNVLGNIAGYQEYVEKDGYVVQSYEVKTVDGIQYVLYHCIYKEKPMIAFIAKISNNYIAAGLLFSNTRDFDQALMMTSDFFSDVTIPNMRVSEFEPDFRVNHIFKGFQQSSRA